MKESNQFAILDIDTIEGEEGAGFELLSGAALRLHHQVDSTHARDSGPRLRQSSGQISDMRKGAASGDLFNPTSF